MLATTNVNCKNNELVERVYNQWLKAGGKRWTRDPHLSPAISADGRMYNDLQRTPTLSLKGMNATLRSTICKSGECDVELYNRAATLLAVRQCAVVEENHSTDGSRYVSRNGRVKTQQEVLQMSYSEKRSDMEWRKARIENGRDLELTQIEKSGPIQQRGISRTDKRQYSSWKKQSPYCREETKEEANAEAHTSLSSENSTIRQRDTAESDDTGVDRTTPLGISAGVQKLESK